MRYTACIPSPEPCAEAGWHARHYLLEAPIDRAFILAMRPLGSFLFLADLAKPFFKVEADHFLIKGLLGDDFLRIAVHRDHDAELARIEALLFEKGSRAGAQGGAESLTCEEKRTGA